VDVPLRSVYNFTGVQKIIVPCTSLRTSKEALRLARIYPGSIYSTAGKLHTIWTQQQYSYYEYFSLYNVLILFWINMTTINVIVDTQVFIFIIFNLTI